MKPLRPYQAEAVGAIFDYWAAEGGNPAIEMATGTGKSLVIAKLVHDIVERYPTMRILMLVHVRELVQQNATELLGEWPGAPIGINSAGLGRRDRHQQVLFASIQSVYRSARQIGPRDLVLVDEAHTIPADGEGMYRTLLEGLRDQVPDLRVVGFTATPYRLGSGRIDRGEGRLFDEIIYRYDVGRGVDDGYLAPLVAQATATRISVEGVARRGGEFVDKDLALVANREDIVRDAVAEIVQHGADRKAWIVFCVDVAHAKRVTAEFHVHAIACDLVTGQTERGQRASIIARFKAGQIRCLISVNVLSIGFNAPQVDLIALLRPTLSTGLYVQQLGRGTRCVGPDIAASVVNGKADCLVLDFAGNVRRHGPVDAIEIEAAERATVSGECSAGSVKPDEVRAKECPLCKRLVAPNVYECPTETCDHTWPKPVPKHEAKPDLEAVIMARHAPKVDYIAVRGVSWDEHFKPGKPSSLRITYTCGLKIYSEWICLEHTGYARTKAERWWHAMVDQEVPTSISEALFRQDEAGQVLGIAVKQDGDFWRVVGHRVLADGDVYLIDGNHRMRPEPKASPKDVAA